MINIKFKKVIIHHFLSFEHSEIDLQNKGYCLVRGINRNPKDSARSNGAGKSSTFNAISFAVTGETLQGLKTNLSNIYFNDGCYVQLFFDVDGHEYMLLRSKDDATYGTNLKITIDGVDKGGKGIRESQELLEQYLPDLTSELLGSTTLIGQNMPLKFTANTPSGRKEVLEHLSQSDFMIQDLKDRINNRSTTLATNMRTVEDKILELSSKENVLTEQLKKSEQEYEDKYAVQTDFDNQITDFKEQKKSAELKSAQCKETINTYTEKLKLVNDELFKISEAKESHSSQLHKMHQEYAIKTNAGKSELMSRVSVLQQEIKRLKEIKDVCPTCGQKIPGVIKQDTSKQENELSSLQKKLDAINEDIVLERQDFDTALNTMSTKYDEKTSGIRLNIKTLEDNLKAFREVVSSNDSLISKLDVTISKLESEKNFFESNKKALRQKIDDLKKDIEKLTKDKEESCIKKDNIQEHINVVNKMNTIIKRDFRGLLLSNIINYIEQTAKEYANKIFGCDELKFELNGNNLDISFCNKDYTNLSGGEKRRIDIIVQFAIRRFLEEYLQFSSNILVLDEITDELDAESCDKVINFITEELQDVESVFIISHHEDSLQLPVDSEIVVEKDARGVSNVI